MQDSEHKGTHSDLSQPYIFIDSCVQIWPDTDFRRLNACGCTAYAVTAWDPHAGAETALKETANWQRIARQYPESTRIVYSAEDIVGAKRNGQAGLILTTQGGTFLGHSLDLLEMFYKMGLRIMIPSYNDRNALCDGCLEPTDAGLSRLGRKWVKECNRLGILIDLSHVGRKASFEIMERSESTVVFTHSNPNALVENARNVTDEQIKLCAETGGIIAPTNWGPLNLRAGMKTRPTLEHYADAIDYIVDLVGIDHVGIGTDMSHGTYPDGDLVRGHATGVSDIYGTYIEASPRSRLRYVEGFDDYGQLLNLVAALKRRGYSEEAVKKVLGGNYLRVFRSVWRS